MKRIIFIRHGKSSWEHPVADKDRTLAKRGINDAHRMGQHLKSINLKIDRAYTSTANRALHTCTIILHHLDMDLKKVHLTTQLYDFVGDKALPFIRTLDNAIHTIALFGHNHAFTTLVNTLGNVYIDNVPTCGAVIIEFKTESWKTISDGRTIETLFPKALKP